MLAIFSIGAGLTHTFGKMVGDRRQGWALFAVMSILFLAGAAPAIWAEQRGNPQFSAIGIDEIASAAQSGGNMEGKEVRLESSSPRSGRPSPPTPRAAPSTRCTTALRRLAGWCRWSTCSLVR